MHFKGHLLLPGESGSGLRVNLDVAAHHLAVESDGGGLGAWPLEVVEVERNGDEFGLIVAGEPLRFVADDTIAFAYTGVPVIEGVSGRSRRRAGFRSVLNRIWSGSDTAAPAVVIQDPPGDEPTPEPAEERQPGKVQEENGVLARTLLATTHLSGEKSLDAELSPEPVLDVEQDSTAIDVCPAVKLDGAPCESVILTGSGYCYPHDPRRAFEDGYQLAQEARAQLKRDSTGRLNRIYERLDRAIRQVERGDLDPQTAMAIAQLARTMCAIVEMDELPEATPG